MNGTVSVQAKSMGMTRASCTILVGYSLSSTRNGGLFCGLLAGMPASTALTDACGRFTVSSGDISCLNWELDSLTRSSARRSLLQFG